jgi:hypothetical protein
MGLYKRKDSKSYWMSFKVKGKRFFESTGTANKKLAERIYAKLLTDIHEGRWFQPQDKKRTLKEMIEKFQKEYTDKKDYYQNKRDKSCFKHFTNFFCQSATLEQVETTVGEYELHRRNQLT